MATLVINLITNPLEKLANILKDSANFQNLGGWEDADEAEPHIYKHALPISYDAQDDIVAEELRVLRPFALIWVAGLDVDMENTGDKSGFTESGTLMLRLEWGANTGAIEELKHEPDWLMFYWQNHLGVILNDILEASSSTLLIRRVSLTEDGIYAVASDNMDTLGTYVGAEFVIEWGYTP